MRSHRIMQIATLAARTKLLHFVFFFFSPPRSVVLCVEYVGLYLKLWELRGKIQMWARDKYSKKNPVATRFSKSNGSKLIQALS